MTVRGPTDRTAIRRHQLAALRRLLRVVATGNPFYGPIFAQVGLDGRLPNVDAFSARMPLTEKEALIDDQRQHPPFGTNFSYPIDQYSRFNQTSATAGKPLRWLDTAASWQSMLDDWKLVFQAAGIQPADRLYFAFSFGPFLGFWTAFEAGTQLGCLCIPGGGTSSLGRLTAMADNQVTGLLCTPTYALRLAEVARQANFDLATLQVRTIIVAGEPGGSMPAVRAEIERHWNDVTVFDHHGMTEIGPVSYQCPEKPGTLLVIESSYLAEIVDPKTTRPAQRGELGELVLTTLGRLGSPLLRYRTGDLVRENTEIAARYGRHELALEGGILGRTDQMLLVRGVNVYPSAVEEVLRGFPAVAEYRVEIQTVGSMTEMQVQVEPVVASTGDLTLAARIEAQLRTALGLRVPVTLCTPGALPRYEMKSRRWLKK